ncbi:Uncharacterized protein BP5553_01806 [Venustampulla echinocandica]|uniref:Altered inheritance of mitochondria protein 21 n=1 Tax=Venustampulla echinocandica TaxID=2656787 RepID=A0A370U224_9HELO|nr:Uncharacterized protein BP5553_01806 [Venustampulla echinocandica]RDL41827.1 Uncharacterized protein BP5553_01806 [Venustampulla echinocandica]
MSTAMPPVPPRPTRNQKDTASSSSSIGSEMPKIPPRPLPRRLDRSSSPSRESFARSPLNETPFPANQTKLTSSNLRGARRPSAELSQSSPNIALPSIGQEGSEYAEIFPAQDEPGTSPTQTRNVADDLQLHAPKPSLAPENAKQRLSTVTRTDSGQAASFGIGKANSDDKEPASHPLKAKASFASQASTSAERPPSSHESEHGIPEIGQRVPMLPDAGDVQAPSPSPFPTPFTPGIGFHNDGSKPRHHGRRTSARDQEVPLEAYGRHGHQVLSHDRFEKAYYEKRPELFKKELGQYGDAKPEWALSSEDLNKIVRDTANRGPGLGTSPAIMGTPTEQVGFQATDEYTSRISSPLATNTSQVLAESPLRKESFPAEPHREAELERALSRSIHAPSDAALESEAEDDDVIHVDPARSHSRLYSREGHIDSTENLGTPGGDEDRNLEEFGYSAPILASDEVAKEPFLYPLQPAVSPQGDFRGGYDEPGFYHNRSGSQGSLSGSRPSSRPGSIHGTLSGLRLPDSTKLEDLEEYEPLFPEDEKNGVDKKPLTAADRLKRPSNRKFPSQDIWEDAPDSSRYTATVLTPQLPEEIAAEKETPKEETPEQAFARKQEELADEEAREQESESFLHQEKKPWGNSPHILGETRPGMKQRFPSRDIWEDTPDSLQFTTTVATPQIPENDALTVHEERPTTGAVIFHQENAAAGLPLGNEEDRATTGLAAAVKPAIPARPAKSRLSQSPEKSQAEPIIPERPGQRARQSPPTDGTSPPVPTKTKPQVPARPSKPITRGSSEDIPLTRAKSNSSDQGVAAAAKPKPPVPSRPVGSKIAALQSGFMSDLNKRLKLGPQAPKKEEPPAEEVEVVKEKAPLSDARKGRARGPARRAPAKAPALIAEPSEKPATLAFSAPSTFWQIDPEKDLIIGGTPEKEEAKSTAPIIEKISEAPALATNTAGELLQDPAAKEGVEKPSLPSAVEKVEEPTTTKPNVEEPATTELEVEEPATTKSNVEAPTTIKPSDDAPEIDKPSDDAPAPTKPNGEPAATSEGV